MSTIPHLRLYFVASIAVLLLKNYINRYPLMYRSNTRNMSAICLFGLAKCLAFRLKNLKRNMVLNQVEVEGLQPPLTPTLTLNFGANMVIGLRLKAKNVIWKRCQSSSFRFIGGYECPFCYTSCRRQRHYIGCSRGLGWLAIYSLWWFHPLNGWDTGFSFSLAQLGLHKGLSYIFLTPALHPKPTILFTP